MRSIVRFVLIGLLVLSGTPVFALPPLVDAAWVKANLNNPNVVFLDIQDAKQYQRFHLPGAVNAPYGRWRTDGKQGGVPSIMPPVARLEKMLGGLGVGNDDEVVVVATGRGAGDLSASARVFWTLKVLGHDKVAVLDGGLVAYARAGQGKNPLEKGSHSREPQVFKAKVDPSFLADLETVKTLTEQQAELVDARSVGEFMGIYAGGAEERAGTIPGSKNLPYDWLTENGSGRLRDLAALKRLYGAMGVGEQGRQVHFCHTGNRAALTWFVSYALLGNDEARLYDASMIEWARRKDVPVETKIKLCERC